MKGYIKSSSMTDDVQRINNLASKHDVSSIITILDNISDGTTLRLAKEAEALHTTSFDKIHGVWVENGTDEYTTYDVADEIVNGRYKYAIEIKDIAKTKPMREVPDRYKPKMWR